MRIIKLALLSLVVSLLYQGSVVKNSKIVLFESRQMVSLNSPIVEIKLDLGQARHQLKLKHEFIEGTTKKVFFNDEELGVSRIKKKKIIETDYYYIEPEKIKQKNILKVTFSSSYPKDLDVRLMNYLPLPKEEISSDLFLLFKDKNFKIDFNFLRWLTISLLIFAFLILANYLISYFNRERDYIWIAVSPIVFLLLIFTLVNFLPFNHYMVAFSDFFFWVTFSLSFISVLIVEENLKKIKG